MINGKIIKVCGMREAENIQDVESIEGIDMLGFIFYPKSPRYVYELPAYLPIHARRVGVFVNEDKQIISMYADRFGLNYVQLHGNESPEYCRSLHSTGLKIIKAFSVDRPKDLRKVYDYEKVCDLSVRYQMRTIWWFGKSIRLEYPGYVQWTCTLPFEWRH